MKLAGAEETVLPTNQYGLVNMPDGKMTFLRFGGLVNLWFPANVGTVYLRGPTFDSLRPFSDSLASPVLAPSGQGFDKDYAGGMSVLRAANGSDLLMFYHAEDQTCGEGHKYGLAAHTSIALAISSDGGVTWNRQGQIITSFQPALPCEFRAFDGAASPSVLKSHDGQYLYAYFSEVHRAGYRDVTYVARASTSSDGRPRSWFKYYRGDFTEPGLGGAGDPVIQPARPFDRTIWAGEPSVSLNVYLRRYLAVVQSDDGLYYTASFDGVNWDTPRLLWAVPTFGSDIPSGTDWYTYPSLLSVDQDSDTVTTNGAYLYCARGQRAGTGDAPHYMVRRLVTIGPE